MNSRYLMIRLTSCLMTFGLLSNLPTASGQLPPIPADEQSEARGSRQPGKPPTIGGQPVAPGERDTLKRIDPRDPIDKPIEDRKRSQYEARLERLKERAGESDRDGVDLDMVNLLLNAGEIHLAFGQENTALDAFHAAWDEMVKMWKDNPRGMPRAARYIAKHFREMDKLIEEDPELALAYMIDLAPLHRDGYVIARETRVVNRYMEPIAASWVAFLDEGQLPPAPLDEAAFWALKIPDKVMKNRQLSDLEEEAYELELAQAETELDRMKQRERFKDETGLEAPRGGNVAERMNNARRQRGVTPGAPQGAGPAGANAALERDLLMLESKREAFTDFARYRAHLKYGQYAPASRAANSAWRALYSYYRSNPTGYDNLDTKIYFDELRALSNRDPIRAALFMTNVDDLHRRVADAKLAIAKSITDQWAEIANRIPLSGKPIEDAMYWMEAMSKQGPDFEASYAAMLEKLKEIKAEEEAAGTAEVGETEETGE